MLCIFVRSIYMFFFQSSFPQTSSTSSKSRYMLRILMRKYALTAYKFLDIGIVVRSISHVAIGDNRGNHMFILHGRHLSKDMQISSN